jgi:DNA-binding CsgD family transcriptional regulator
LVDLSERERQAVALAAIGHANKLIAYDLGIAATTVAELLKRAAVKLGAESRVALIRAFRERLAPAPQDRASRRSTRS